jgi:uncharacterized Fe-S center protein
MAKYKVSTGCTFCGMCVVLCPVKAITLGPKGAHINQEKCMGCGICYLNCASEAIQKVKQTEEVKRE